MSVDCFVIRSHIYVKQTENEIQNLGMWGCCFLSVMCWLWMKV